jgi:hypothetical protein
MANRRRLVLVKADGSELMILQRVRERILNMSLDELQALTKHIEGWKNVDDLMGRIDAWLAARYNSLPD